MRKHFQKIVTKEVSLHTTTEMKKMFMVRISGFAIPLKMIKRIANFVGFLEATVLKPMTGKAFLKT